jgi:hypothetical protein
MREGYPPAASEILPATGALRPYGRYVSFVASRPVLLRPPTARINPLLATAPSPERGSGRLVFVTHVLVVGEYASTVRM